MRKHILGVVGGMGPLATEVLYKYIIENTKADKDQDHIDMVILSAASMPDRTEAILNENTSCIIDEFRKDLKILEFAGAEHVVIPCNTCHVILDDIRALTNLNIIDMLDVCAASINEPGTKVGIMATDGTVKSGLYHKAVEKYGMVPVDLSPEMQELTMHIIYDHIKAGKPADLNELGRIEQEFFSKGCRYIILGCTELSCIKDSFELPDFYIDPMMILARYVIPLTGGELIDK